MSQSTSALPVELLWEKFSYNPFTGHFHHISTDKPVKGYFSIDQRNYRRCTIHIYFNKKTRIINYSRAVHAWFTGSWATKGFHVDHINGDSGDNRLWNLRCVTARENNQNRKNQGSPGIYWNKRLKKWQAQIRIKGSKVYLGIFKKESDALERYIHACDSENYPVLPEVRQRLQALRASEALQGQEVT